MSEHLKKEENISKNSILVTYQISTWSNEFSFIQNLSLAQNYVRTDLIILIANAYFRFLTEQESVSTFINRCM